MVVSLLSWLSCCCPNMKLSDAIYVSSFLYILQIAGDFYPKLLEKSLQVAESQAANSFHCKTLNCVGWCIYEDDVNFFQCVTCGVKNCLTCQAIHENQNCKEYQEEVKLKAANDADARRTQEEIEVCMS